MRPTIAILPVLLTLAIAGCDRPKEADGQANATAPADNGTEAGNASAEPERVGTIDRTHKGEAAPATPFKAPDGKTVTLADFKGKPVLLNLWATWCAPCVREMPALDRLQKELGGGDFEVVAISVDQGGMKPVEPFLTRYQLSTLTPYLNPDASLFWAFGEKTLPVTYLIGRDGRAVGRIEGAAEWDSAGGKRLIRHYLDQPPQGG